MRKLAYFAVIAAFLALDWSAAAPAKKKAPAHKTTTRHTATRSKTSTHSKTTARRRTSSKHRTATTWRNRQMAPTPDRYKEIQAALVSKGYLTAEEANGTWGPSSVDALKRFQAEQNIEATGKINSLSLIALGLGPKREPAPVPAPTPANPIPEPASEQ